MALPIGPLDVSSIVRAVSAVTQTISRLTRLFSPLIDGIEITQAIQYYKADQHLTDADDRGPDNSLRLVAAKPAWVRVYLTSVLIDEIANVTGDLVVERASGPFNLIWTRVAILSPRTPGTATARREADYATTRSTLSDTLNFVIPADQVWGRMRVTARVWQTGSSSPSDTRLESFSATLLQTLRLRGILISYNGTDAAGTTTLNLAAPTLANLQTTAAWTLTVDPLQAQGSFVSAGSMTWSTPLIGTATAPGGCSTEWLSLNAAVAEVKANDGNRSDVIYYGLLPAGIPIANVGGCESSGVSSGRNGDQVTMAHEVGHAAGLIHGPCGTSSGDDKYPAYEPYDTDATRISSIGEYGLDINTGTILSPADSDDYMSYCDQEWISIYHHDKLLNHPKFDPQTVGALERLPEFFFFDPWLWPWEYLVPPRRPGFDWQMTRAERVISLIGIGRSDGALKVQSVMRVFAVPVLEGSASPDLVASLLDSEGKTISAARVVRLSSVGCAGPGGCRYGCGADSRDSGPFVFQVLIPTSETGSSLRIGRTDDDGDHTLWERHAPDTPPNIVDFRIEVEDNEGSAYWRIDAAEGVGKQASLQLSKDGGRSWNGLAAGLTGNSLRFELASLPSGSVIFKLLAHDGFHTIEAVSKPVDLPPRAPTVSIMHPQQGEVLPACEPLRLWATASTGSGRPIEADSCGWMVDGKFAGQGLEVWIDAPGDGPHCVSFSAIEGGEQADASVEFRTRKP
ncbi:hypothetical protein [Nocardia abscessus]|uniref:hypothetical protein n=1 Tax=Nocardia abscessus TaxID=120957 RepID=UPI00245439C9|nr:hypothetical protein [Nocardia abscessus]